MSVSVSVKKIKGCEYVFIVENFRDPITRRPTSRTLESFGNKEKLLGREPDAMARIRRRADELRKSLKTRGSLSSAVIPDETALPPPSRLFSAEDALLGCVWDELGFGAYLGNAEKNCKLDYSLNRAVFLSCAGQIFRPVPKNALWSGRDRYLSDFEDVSEENLYGCLRILEKRKTSVARKINACFSRSKNQKLTVTLFDGAAFLLAPAEKQSADPARQKRKYQKKPVQTAAALFSDGPGTPLGLEFLNEKNGGTQTLLRLISKYKSAFGMTSVTLVSDGVPGSLIDFSALAGEGVRFVSAFRMRLGKTDQRAVLAQEGWSHRADRNGFRLSLKELRETDPEEALRTLTGRPAPCPAGTRCLALYSERQSTADASGLRVKIERGYVQTEDCDPADEFRTLAASGNPLSEDDIALFGKDAKWNGFRAIVTNFEDAPPETHFRLFSRLWKTEKAFRMPKEDLAVPEFSRTGQVIVSFMALAAKRLIEEKLRRKGLDVGAERVFEAFSSLRICPLPGLKKNCEKLFACAYEAAGEDMSAQQARELCERASEALGLEPLRALESAQSLQKKLRLRTVRL